MKTVICNEGVTEIIITQKYEIGLYVAVYDEDYRIKHQFGVNDEEESFHQKLRDAYKVNGGQNETKQSSSTK